MPATDVSFTQPLYDTVRLDFPSETTDLFQVPIGAGQTAFGSGPKTLADTNLVMPAMVPPGTSFLVSSLYAEPLWTLRDQDMVGATFEVVIGARSSLQIPFSRARISLVVSDASAQAARELAAALAGLAPEAVPMVLGALPDYSFGFDLGAHKLLVTPANLIRVILRRPSLGDVAGGLRVYLNGTLKRSVV